MRLLNVHTREISEFLSDTDIEPYAILSHTWRHNEEASFEDFQSLPKGLLTAKKGYTKIDYCCRQAEADGYDWVWADTYVFRPHVATFFIYCWPGSIANECESCCIDKRSSAELSEAINSMFRLYKGAAVCYAYFADVQTHDNSDRLHTELTNSRWFTRGWTLQELLAPREMVLYTFDWQRIGSRFEFRDALSKITSIEVEYLCGNHPLERASVSKRMSWAATRDTSRTEDIAYCLLGIFDVNMPLLYGEGKKAFRRLQEEILKANPMDHTLFAWGKIVDVPKRQITDPLQLQGQKPIPWSAADASESLRGLFAESPKEFLHSGGFSPWRGTEGFYNTERTTERGTIARTSQYYPTVAGESVNIALPFQHFVTLAAFHWPEPQITQLRLLGFGILLCEHGPGRPPGLLLPLQGWGDYKYGRTNELMYNTNIYNSSGFLAMRQQIRVEPQKHRDPQPADFLIRPWGNSGDYNASLSTEGLFILNENIVAPTRGATGRLWARHFRLTKNRAFTTPDGRGFEIVFSRAEPEPTRPGVASTLVSMVPLLPTGWTSDVVKADGFVWYNRSNERNDQSKFLFSRTMEVPVDTWRLDVAPFPLVEVRVTRMSIGAGPGDVVDVVDFMISDRVCPCCGEVSPEMEDSEVEEPEVEDSGVEDSEREKSEVEKSEEPGQGYGRRNSV
jgi:hypothetical protein